MQLTMRHYLTIYLIPVNNIFFIYVFESRQTGANDAHPETNTVLLFLRVMRFAHAKTHTHTCITLLHTDKKFKKEK